MTPRGRKRVRISGPLEQAPLRHPSSVYSSPYAARQPSSLGRHVVVPVDVEESSHSSQRGRESDDYEVPKRSIEELLRRSRAIVDTFDHGGGDDDGFINENQNELLDYLEDADFNPLGDDHADIVEQDDDGANEEESELPLQSDDRQLTSSDLGSGLGFEQTIKIGDGPLVPILESRPEKPAGEPRTEATSRGNENTTTTSSFSSLLGKRPRYNLRTSTLHHEPFQYSLRKPRRGNLTATTVNTHVTMRPTSPSRAYVPPTPSKRQFMRQHLTTTVKRYAKGTTGKGEDITAVSTTRMTVAPRPIGADKGNSVASKTP
jgi:hypothetical protein